LTILASIIMFKVIASKINLFVYIILQNTSFEGEP
jgi:hypothetical protein